MKLKKRSGPEEITLTAEETVEEAEAAAEIAAEEAEVVAEEAETAPTAEEPSPAPDASPRRRPVLVYIMILFIAAFLLMAMSLVMHQRSNDAAMHQLQSSVNAIQNAQGLQERVIELQDELLAAEEALEEAKQTAAEDLKAQQTLLDLKQHQADALTRLYQLQQAYADEDIDLCSHLIDTMIRESDETVLDLAFGDDTATSPSACFKAIRNEVGMILRG